MRLSRRRYLRRAGVAGAGIAAFRRPRGGEPFETIDVPGDEPTIRDGVDAAEPGDLVLLEPGTYPESIEVTTPGVTIRGRDRNEVVLDGEFERNNGIVVEADGVAIENLTARHYEGTAFYWRGVEGFRGSYLTAYNDGYYGLYAYGSRDGRFEHSYASGHPDAGFYLGWNHPFHAVVSNVVAEHNLLGYSGTSAGGDLTIRDSVWRENAAGIVPNTLDADDPQRSTRVVDNVVVANNDAEAPTGDVAYPMLGAGIVAWGGSYNLIERNEVDDHDYFGIVLEPNEVEPAGNVVRENAVSGSGTADLALGTPAGDGNLFRNNAFETSLPPEIERGPSDGDGRVARTFARLERRAERGELVTGDWQEGPVPDEQPSMADPTAPPRSADRDTAWDGPGE